MDPLVLIGQALTDRFVEAFAERLHADMRKDIWGYAADEKASAACSTGRPLFASKTPRPIISDRVAVATA